MVAMNDLASPRRREVATAPAHQPAPEVLDLTPQPARPSRDIRDRRGSQPALSPDAPRLVGDAEQGTDLEATHPIALARWRVLRALTELSIARDELRAALDAHADTASGSGNNARTEVPSALAKSRFSSFVGSQTP